MWPPPPTQSSVWPPPPMGQGQGFSAPAFSVPFKTIFRYSEGSVPNLRVGSVSLSDQGIYIQGQSTPRYEIQMPILLACILLGAGWLIAYLIMEYAVRNPESVVIPWEHVQRVVFVPKKRQICLVYQAPNYKGVVKTFSLAFTLEQSLFDQFIAAAHEVAPGKVTEGKLRAWTSPVVWLVFSGILLYLLFLGILFAVGAMAPTSSTTTGR